MKKEIIQSLTKTFEDYANVTENNVEFWFARDLQHLLGYTKWDNFLKVINKAKTSCEASGNEIIDHFAEVGKMVMSKAKKRNLGKNRINYLKRTCT